MNIAVSHLRMPATVPIRPDVPSPRRLARVAGLMYLALAVLTGFANAAAAGLYVPGDAAATMARLAADPVFVRAAVVADLAGATAWVLLVLALSRLLRAVDRDAANALVVFSSLGAGIMMLNAVLEFAGLRIATGAVDLSALGAAGSNAVALLMLDMHHYGVLVAAVFMGLWLFPLGVLTWRSQGMLPAWIGVLLALGGVCYLVYVLTAFIAPDAYRAIKDAILVVPTIPEVAMVAFLLTVGVRAPQREHVHPGRMAD